MEQFRSSLLNQILVISGVLSTILSCGLGVGYMAAFLDSQRLNTDDHSLRYIETCGEIAFVSSILLIPFIMQKQGRRIANVVTGVSLILSWLVSFIINNKATMIVNILHNISLGGAVSTSSVIISEFCSPACRSTVLMLETVMISLGVLITHVFGLYSYWQLISSFGLLTATTSLTVTCFWPESPYWLVSQGHMVKCTESFHWLRGYDEKAIEELDGLLMMYKIKFQLQALKPIKKLSIRRRIAEYSKTLLKKDFLKPLSIMLLLVSFVGLGGENLVTNFSFRDIFKLTYGKYIGTIILDVLTLVCSLIACVLIQIVERKSLFIFTGSVSIIFFGITSLVLFLQTLELLSSEYVWLLLTFSTGFAIFMSLGTTALPFSLVGEIFPMSYKGVGCSLTCAYLWAFGNSVLKSVPQLIMSIGLFSLILIAVVLMIIILNLLYKILPETSCYTLLEIEQLLVKSRKNNTYDIISINETELTENFDNVTSLEV